MREQAFGKIPTGAKAEVAARQTAELAQSFERKQADIASGLLEAIVDSSEDAIIGNDLNGVITSWNKGAETIFGYLASEAVGTSIMRLLPADRHDEMNDILTRIKNDERVKHYDSLRQTKDGRLIDVSVTVSPIKNAAGDIIGASKVSRDVTERRRMEQALRESEKHFRFLSDLVEATRALADPAQIMAVTARMLGEYLCASRCAYADVARDGEQFTILHDYTDGCASTVGQYQLSHFGARAVDTLRHGQTLIIRNVETELLAGEGADMFNAIGIKAIITCPLVKDDGLRAMMAVHQSSPRDWQPAEIAIVQDVVERCWATIERKTAEDRILQLNVELEQRVMERTAELETTNRELEAFSYSVSHDLRAPLRAVDGFAQAVLEDYGAQLPEEGQRYLKIIRKGTQAMGALIDDLLTFSRLGRAQLHKQEVNTGQLVANVLDDLRATLAGRQIDVRIAELPACAGDAALLKQVWINLLSNAVKFTRGRDNAVVEIGCETRPGSKVYFVRDNGTGFDMRYVDKLFGVFQRLHRAEEYEGTGVGLAIVQRIVQRHGGRIWTEGAIGRGATFYFTLE
jgi:PAS domain S-box-containing protein